MTNQELLTMIREVKEYQLMADELTTTIEGLKDRIKEHMTAQGKEELVIDVHKVRYQIVKSNRIDTTALKKELPDIAQRFTKESESRRFTIA